MRERASRGSRMRRASGTSRRSTRALVGGVRARGPTRGLRERHNEAGGRANRAQGPWILNQMSSRDCNRRRLLLSVDAYVTRGLIPRRSAMAAPLSEVREGEDQNHG